MNEPEIIYKAVQDGSIQVLSQLFYLDPKLINHRCEINNKTLVETAVELGQEEVLQFLLQFHDLCVSEGAYVAYTGSKGCDPFVNTNSTILKIKLRNFWTNRGPF